MILRRLRDICDLKYLAIALELEKGQLKVKISFLDMHFNYLTQLKAPKLWEEPYVQSNIAHWVTNTKSFFEQDSTINLFEK